MAHPVVRAGLVATVAIVTIGVMAIVALTASETSRYAPLIGPCADRKGPDKAYYNLASSMVFERINPFDVQSRDATPETVDRMKAEIARLRQDWVPTLPDPCLIAHVQDWLSHYDRRASQKLAEKQELGSFASDYEKERAEEADQKRALAARIGVRP